MTVLKPNMDMIEFPLLENLHMVKIKVLKTYFKNIDFCIVSPNACSMVQVICSFNRYLMRALPNTL